MDFFDHQERSLRRSRWLVLLFALAVVVTAAGVTVVISALAFFLGARPDVPIGLQSVRAVFDPDLVTVCAVATIAFIGAAVLLRLIRLRAGGSVVAENLGGARVDPGDSDPGRRRLMNVVEEMAIASGLPVPLVYVMEREPAINAFAAGSTPSDAAIAVTRGCLENLDRDQLQGVIAHEFSHILHGDMRMNLRLIGYLFGIMSVNMLGRAMMRTAGRRRFGRSGGRSGLVLVLGGSALYVLGLAGVLAGRLIQAAVCRQREYLADASAVQFSRQTDGLAGALRLINGRASMSHMRAGRAEEVGHMLFVAGRRAFASLFATHPPIEARLRALEPHGAGGLGGESDPIPVSASPADTVGSAAGISSFAAAEVTNAVGNPGEPQVHFAQGLEAIVPPLLWEAAHSMDGGLPVLLALLLDANPQVSAHQLALVEVRFGVPVRTATERSREDLSGLSRTLKLALADVAFQSVRGMKKVRRDYVLETAERMVQVDGRVDAFEKAMMAALASRVRDLESRRRSRPARGAVDSAAQSLLAAMALAGHPDRDSAPAAYRAGLDASRPFSEHLEPELPDDAQDFDKIREVLAVLDGLPPHDKRRLVAGLSAAAASDSRIVGREADILRAVCSALHCPIPPPVSPGR
ncbi:MAG: M48 family metallopeptidase [Chromatiales bacterium]|jgi:Zn-dependent protease with chaperone function|nr:M48 family metallopeptidase [Chromatiales bacterium]MDH4029531.1 M48 family metallopeptidase [Chromatiales bacterium]